MDDLLSLLSWTIGYILGVAVVILLAVVVLRGIIESLRLYRRKRVRGGGQAIREEEEG